MRAVVVLALVLSACAHVANRASGTRALQLDLAREMMQRGEWDQAFVVLQPLARETPDDPVVLAMRGRVYEAQGLLREAELDLRHSLKLRPDDAAAHSALAVLLDGTARHVEALAQHRDAARLAPGNPAYLNNLGFALFIAGRTSEAIVTLRAALQQDPTDRRIRNNLGFAEARAGEWTDAVAQFERGGGAAGATNNLGVARELAGDDARAREAYLRAARLDPSEPHARANLERLILRAENARSEKP